MKALLDQIKTYSMALSSASKWHGSKESIASIKDTSSDYIYEFFCYLTVLNDLQFYYDLEFRPGTGINKYAFPKSPASKKGRPLFVVLSKTTGKVAFQVCAGTKIKTQYGTERAPDISFQNATSPDNPTSNDVFMIYDAKFNRLKSAKAEIDQNQYSYVAQMIRDLDLHKRRAITIHFFDLGALQGNCIITNGKASNSSVQRNQDNNLKEVGNFITPFNAKKLIIIG